MLHGTLELHDIRDVEAFVAKIVDRSRLELGYHDREDLSAYLLAEAWELSVGFRPGTASFSTYAGTRLRLRVAEWKRNRDGRTIWKFRDRVYERELPSFTEYDENTVGAPAVDSGERGDSDSDRRLDSNGTISAAAYFPPRGLCSPRGVSDAPHGSAESNGVASRKAA